MESSYLGIVSKPSTYRLLGVDPGTNELGYAILEITGKQATLIKIDTLRMHQLSEHSEKLAHIFNVLSNIIDQYRPTEMAIEAPFFGKNVQSMLKLGRAQGVAMAAAMTKDLKITEYSPKKVKQSVTGNGNASKEQVASMITTILGKHDKVSLDGTDAAAVALCHFYQGGNSLTSGKKYASWEKFLQENPNRSRGN